MTDYNAIGYDPDEGPSLVLQCPACAAHIPFYSDPEGCEHIEDGAYKLGEYELVLCACGAAFGEGDWLDVVIEP